MTIRDLSLVFLEDNPNLGPARVVRGDPPAPDELRMLFSGAAHPFRRETRLALYPLPVGSAVRYRPAPGTTPMAARVLRELPRQSGQRRRFAIVASGHELEADESTIEPASPNDENIVERLQALRWDRPPAFYARRGVLQLLKVWYEDTDGLPTLTGARVESMAHQIHAVQRVLWARTPRFILADEVGLGKTIEAGLILQALMASDPEMSVLVIAPGSMTRQWLCELYLRFGARPFQVVTDLKEEIGSQAIVSTTCLNRQPKAWNRLTDRRWSMVVIDEAHQYPPGSVLYALFRTLATQCDGILVLSATPSKRQISGILGLLALVAPEQYGPDDEVRVGALWGARQKIWDRLSYHHSLRAAPDFVDMQRAELAAVADDWAPLLAGDVSADLLIARLRTGDRTAFDELEAYVQEYYRLDHRIIRTRRRTIQTLGQTWCERVLEVVEYEPSVEESLIVDHVEEAAPRVAAMDPARRALAATFLRLVQLCPSRCLAGLQARRRAIKDRLSNSISSVWWDHVLSDPSPEEEDELRRHILLEVAPFAGEEAWIDQAVELAKAWVDRSPLGARHLRAIDWIASYLDKRPNDKLLVFTEDRLTARIFAEVLGDRLEETVDAFHWVDSEDDEEDLKRITSEFQRDPQRHVLVSDELGGEGRNFQMAEAVLHLDCPWAVARLEQRIGRLDRIGRQSDRPVRSVVFLGQGAIERAIHQVHAEVFQVYTRSLGGLEFLLPGLQRDLFDDAVSGASVLTSRHDARSLAVTQALRDADQDLDQSLDTSRQELERAAELAEVLKEIDGLDRREPMQFWARTLGLRADEHDSADGAPEFSFRWTPAELPTPLPGEWGGGSFRTDSGTFDRYEALEREDLQFFGLGHRLIDAQLRALRTTHVGRLTVFGRDLGQGRRGELFVLIIVHFDLDASLWTDEPFDTGLMTRARRRLYPEAIERVLQLRTEGVPLASFVEDPKLKREIAADFEGRSSAYEVKPTALAALDVGALGRAMQEAMSMAVLDAASERLSYSSDALEELRADLGPEMGFLEGQLRRTNDAQAATALRHRQLLMTNFTQSRSEVAGVALIVGM